jgi:hypothetical protein
VLGFATGGYATILGHPTVAPWTFTIRRYEDDALLTSAPGVNAINTAGSSIPAARHISWVGGTYNDFGLCFMPYSINTTFQINELKIKIRHGVL